jgi:putative pyruvate formate lyase activating enzyme
LLDGIVDIFMPDFKFWGTESSRLYLKAKDYPDRAREAILEMHRQVGPLRIGSDGIARRGLLVRHLVMPGHLEETRAIFRWLAQSVSADTYVNIMAQYRPENRVGEKTTDGRVRYREINRRPSRDEMAEAYQAARDAGLRRFD